MQHQNEAEKFALAYALAGISSYDLLRDCRKQALAWKRQTVFYLMRYSTSLSFPVLGRMFRRDHSTIIHGVNLVERRMKANPSFERYVKNLLERVKGCGRLAEQHAFAEQHADRLWVGAAA